jgi:hypothetical protein
MSLPLLSGASTRSLACYSCSKPPGSASRQASTLLLAARVPWVLLKQQQQQPAQPLAQPFALILPFLGDPAAIWEGTIFMGLIAKITIFQKPQRFFKNRRFLKNPPAASRPAGARSAPRAKKRLFLFTFLSLSISLSLATLSPLSPPLNSPAAPPDSATLARQISDCADEVRLES